MTDEVKARRYTFSPASNVVLKNPVVFPNFIYNIYTGI